jgi:hypothetical protein
MLIEGGAVRLIVRVEPGAPDCDGFIGQRFDQGLSDPMSLQRQAPAGVNRNSPSEAGTSWSGLTRPPQADRSLFAWRRPVGPAAGMDASSLLLTLAAAVLLIWFAAEMVGVRLTAALLPTTSRRG